MPDPAPIPDGSVVITPNQQYAELRSLTDAVKELSAKVDPTLVGLRKDVDEVTKDVTAEVSERKADVEKERSERKADVEKIHVQLSAIQKWQYTIGGGLALLVALVGWGAINFARLGGG